MGVDDLYPVAVSSGELRYSRARVLTRDGRVRVFVDSGTRVELVLDEELSEVRRLNGATWELDLVGHDELSVRRVGGCGCGSRLKRLDVNEAWAST